jgi:hypothetical protein
MCMATAGTETSQTRLVRVIVLAGISIFFAAACGFFAWYAVRLAYVNLTAEDIAAHRQAGMYIGAAAFPVAAAAFGWLALRCARAAVGASRNGGRH